MIMNRNPHVGSGGGVSMLGVLIGGLFNGFDLGFDNTGTVGFAFSPYGTFYLIMEQNDGQLQYIGFNGVVSGAAAAEIGLPSLEGIWSGDYNWITYSPAPPRPDTTPATDQQKLKAVKVAGMKASHDFGCVVDAELGMIPVVGPLMSGGASTALGLTDSGFGYAEDAHIVASQFNNRFSNGVADLTEKLGRFGTAFSAANAMVETNACIDNGPALGGF